MCDDIMTVSQCARKIGRSECYVNGLISGGLLHVIHTNPRNHRKWIRGKKEISILAARPDFKRLLEKATQLAKQAKQFCHNQHADQLLDKWGKE